MAFLEENPRAWPLAWLFIQIVLSMAISLLLAALYRRFTEAAVAGSGTHRSFWMLSVAVTVIFVTVRSSIATGLTLIGALTLVRFRNPIKEPEEIGFILLVIASALTVTAWRLDILGAVLIIVSIVLTVQALAPGRFTGSSKAGLIVLTMPSTQYSQTGQSVSGLVHEKLYRGAMEGFSENNGEVVISYNFGALTEVSFEALRAALRERSPDAKLNVIYHRANSP
jgi:hypothetical protein